MIFEDVAGIERRAAFILTLQMGNVFRGQRSHREALSRIDGGAGNDYLSGGHGDDAFYGGSGDDTLFGNAGNDYLLGERGHDYLIGGQGADILYGGSYESDYLWAGDLNDAYDSARDTLYVKHADYCHYGISFTDSDKIYWSS